jgi:hypothetical protein
VRALPLVLVLVGCGSSWDLREGVQGPPLECESLLNYYVDADGDGWGDPGTVDAPAEPQPLCNPDENAQLTATNAMDCDDSDPDIGPDAGVCPASIGDDDAGEVARIGLVRGTSEYLFVLATGPEAERGAVEEKATEAEDWCESWAGQLTEGSPEGDRGLIVLTDPAEVAEVNTALDEALATVGLDGVSCSGTELGCVAMFVGMRWEGGVPTSCESPVVFDGGWVWEDGQGPTGDIPFCDNIEPTPQDFMVGTQLCGLDDADEIVASLRMALVRRSNGWCLGTAPFQPGLPNLDEFGVSRGNHPDSAFFACERPVFDPAKYVDVPEAGAREGK